MAGKGPSPGGGGSSGKGSEGSKASKTPKGQKKESKKNDDGKSLDATGGDISKAPNDAQSEYYKELKAKQSPEWHQKQAEMKAYLKSPGGQQELADMKAGKSVDWNKSDTDMAAYIKSPEGQKQVAEMKAQGQKELEGALAKIQQKESKKNDGGDPKKEAADEGKAFSEADSAYNKALEAKQSPEWHQKQAEMKAYLKSPGGQQELADMNAGKSVDWNKSNTDMAAYIKSPEGQKQVAELMAKGQKEAPGGAPAKGEPEAPKKEAPGGAPAKGEPEAPKKEAAKGGGNEKASNPAVMLDYPGVPAEQIVSAAMEKHPAAITPAADAAQKNAPPLMESKLNMKVEQTVPVEPQKKSVSKLG